MQSWNPDGVLSFLRLLLYGPSAVVKQNGLSPSYAAHRLRRRAHFFLPHLHVRGARSFAQLSLLNQYISEIDFAALKRAGCEGLLFDKDQTLTAPYADTLHPSITAAWQSCCDHFSEKERWIVSNSVGTSTDDPTGEKARHLAAALSCPVLRYTGKKPVRLTEQTLGFAPANAAIIGDRLLTDIYMGHQMGMLTILVDPFPRIASHQGLGEATSTKEDNLLASWLRSAERRWLRTQSTTTFDADHPILKKYKEDILRPHH